MYGNVLKGDIDDLESANGEYFGHIAR